MSDELARLRADLDVFERHGLVAEATFMRNKIAHLEAEAADPWREAKQVLLEWSRLDSQNHGEKWLAINFVTHLTAERNHLAARVAELEAAQADDLNDTNPPKFEIAGKRTVKYTDAGPLRPRDVSDEFDDVDDDPILDPARVLATAFDIIGGHVKFDAKPYRLKRGGQ